MKTSQTRSPVSEDTNLFDSSGKRSFRVFRMFRADLRLNRSGLEECGTQEIRKILRVDRFLPEPKAVVGACWQAMNFGDATPSSRSRRRGRRRSINRLHAGSYMEKPDGFEFLTVR